jgi:hypothetical protein
VVVRPDGFEYIRPNQNIFLTNGITA